MNEDKNNSDGAFPDELVSAYLDGELSPAEKLRVEEQLMDSAEHRQLFEELKALRQGMQSLPQRKLDADFASRVLQRAEKQLLAEDVPEDDGKPTATLPVSGSKAEDRAAWRGLIWSVSAMAAAIMLIVFSPWLANDRNTGNGVALNTTGETQEHNEAEHGSLTREEESKPRDGEGLAKEKGGRKSQSQGITEKYDNEPGEELRQFANSDGASHGASSSNTVTGAEADPRSRPAGNRNSRVGNKDNYAQIAPGAGSQVPRLKNELNGASDRYNLAARSAPDSFGGGSAEFSRFEQIPNPGESVDASSVESRMFALTADQLASDMMVISIDVTPEALSEEIFDKMLQKHNIGTGKAQDELAQAGLIQQLRDVEKKIEKSKQDERSDKSPDDANALAIENQTDAKDADAVELLEMQKLTRGREHQRRAVRKAHGDVDVMMVVATPSQIDGLLKDMRSQEKYVLAMASDRPMEASKKSRAAFRTQDRFYENEELKLLADESTGQREKGNEADRTLKSAEKDKELVVDAVESPTVQNNGERADEAAGSGEGGPRATVARPAQNESNVEAGASPAEERLDEFRGIARRLHLPEDFQRDLTNNKRSNSEGTVDPKWLAQSGAVAGGGGAHGGQQGQQETTQSDYQGREDQAREGQSRDAQTRDGGFARHAVGREEGNPQQPSDGRIVAKGAKEPLVRVLFVLRATGNTATILANEPQPPAGVPSDSVPANAALREAAEAEVAPPAVDE